MEIRDKIVEFDKYCKTCKFCDLIEDENGAMPEPCNECLNNPVHEYSKKPVKYQPDEKRIAEQNKIKTN